MAFSEYSFGPGRPEKPLVVKCTFDRSMRRITFSSAQNCSYDLLRTRVEQCFSLYASPFTVTYKDDDGEVTDINSDDDLTEAIHYFHSGDDGPISSNASAYSGRSSTSGRKITLRVDVVVDYDGPSLSDTASLSSLEEYKNTPPNDGQQGVDTFSLISYGREIGEGEDDTRTISSHPTVAKPNPSSRGAKRTGSTASTESFSLLQKSNETSRMPSKLNLSTTLQEPPTLNTGAVFERLKQAETAVYSRSPSTNGVGGGTAQWLKEQNIQMMQSVLGTLPAPSTAPSRSNRDLDRDSIPESGIDEVEEVAADEIPGGLELEQNPHGTFYYTYTGSSSGHDMSFHGHGPPSSIRTGDGPDEPVPSSSSRPPTIRRESTDTIEIEQPEFEPAPSADEFLRFLPPSNSSESLVVPDPAEVTDCAACGTVLDTFRYVCATCGPRPPKASIQAAEHERDPDPLSKGKARAIPTSPVPASSPFHTHSNSSFESHSSSPHLSHVYPPRSPPYEALRVVPNGSSIFEPGRSPQTATSNSPQFNGSSPHLPGSYSPYPQPSYPPPPSPSLTSWTISDIGSSVPLVSLGSRPNNKPLPKIPSPNGSDSSPSYYSLISHTSSPQPQAPPQAPARAGSESGRSGKSGKSGRSVKGVNGFELCMVCMETAGIEHASESVGPVASPQSGPPTPVDGRDFYAAPPMADSSASIDSSGSWKRTVSRKGLLRHAFKEKVWSSGKWTDVEHDELSSKCTTCGSGLTTERFKCATCLDMVVCLGCYNRIHEIHPIHAFLVLPEERATQSVTTPPAIDADASGEESLLHDGIKCSHCLMDIVGARFRCAICPNVDICQNCESAGLPGNLTAPDGGHISSHIMIKIPFPLPPTEVETATRRVLRLWTGRDGSDAPGSNSSDSDGRNHSNPSGGSGSSAYATTVIGAGRSANADSGMSRMDHGMRCKGCRKGIVGVRYQCAGCPSPDGEGFSLCVDCEARSYQLHDPMHCFFKIPRPLNRKIQEPESLVPTVYILAAGESLDDSPFDTHNHPRAYLQSIVHRSAFCDRCVQRIVGEWFRCAYCAKDLCDSCESMDSHDDSHLFIVFKSVVDMGVLREFTNLEDPGNSPPLIPYPVYNTH